MVAELSVDFDKNHSERQKLARMLLRSDPNKGVFYFYLISEPEPDSDDDEAKDVGFSEVNIRDIYRKKKNYEKEYIPSK